MTSLKSVVARFFGALFEPVRTGGHLPVREELMPAVSPFTLMTMRPKR